MAPVPIPLGVAAGPGQEVPPVTVPSMASGAGIFTVNAERTEISYNFNFTGPFTSEPQQAHLHIGAIGDTGPVVFFLCATDTMTPAPAPAGIQACPSMAGGNLQGTLTEMDLIPQAAVGVETFEQALAAIIGGNAYLNLHTPSNPSGEVRGQLGEVGLGALLSSAAEVPPVMTPSDATGIGTVTMPPERGAITFSLNFTGPFTGDVTAVHIHMGAEDEAGSVIFDLCPPPADPPPPGGNPPCVPMAGGPLEGTRVEADLVQPATGVITLADAINALISGNTYFNAHTAANPGGEVRGQIRVALESTLSSAAEVPPVVVPSEATGSALLVPSQDRSEVAYSLTLTGPFTGDPTQAHIHLAPEGETGPVVVFICAEAALNPPMGTPTCPDAMGGTLDGAITSDNFIAPAMGPQTFEEFVDALFNSDAYFNVHTEDNTSGEIRGQIVPVRDMPEVPMEVSFAMQIQPIFNENCSCHLSTPGAGMLSLLAGQSHGNLVNVPSAQQPNFMRVLPGNSKDSYLFMKHSGDSRISGDRMPRNDPTFFDRMPELLDLERRWIDEGAMNN